MNRSLYDKKDIGANVHAERVKDLYKRDSMLALFYNKEIANGKWSHMMDHTHIGYTYWQQPNRQSMPEVKYVVKDSIIEKKDMVDSTANSASYFIPHTNENIFIAPDRYVSIEASHFTKSINSRSINWKVLPDHGRTGDAITTFPVTSANQKPGGNAPHLEYEFYTYSSGDFKLNAYFSPSLNFHNTETGLQYAISIDDELPQIISINSEDKNTGSGIWNKWVSENIIIKISNHKISALRKHTVKYWMVNPGVVLQKLVLDFGGVKPSYLGPPETIIKK